MAGKAAAPVVETPFSPEEAFEAPKPPMVALLEELGVTQGSGFSQVDILGKFALGPCKVAGIVVAGMEAVIVFVEDGVPARNTIPWRHISRLVR